MKPFLSSRSGLIGLAVLLALAASCPDVRAGWGSVRANNRSAPAPRAPVHEAPRPVVHEAPRPEPPRVEPHAPARPEEHRGVVERGREPVRVDEAVRAREFERRRLDIDEERRHAFFWYGFHPGMLIPALPVGWISLNVGGAPYDYYQGVYYQNTPGGYVVVAPPVGALVPELPPGAETVFVESTPYYYANGAFYLQVANGFQVVSAPLGVAVSSLPPDASGVVINGTTYYLANSAHYLPVMEGGATVYYTEQPR